MEAQELREASQQITPLGKYIVKLPWSSNSANMFKGSIYMILSDYINGYGKLNLGHQTLIFTHVH